MKKFLILLCLLADSSYAENIVGKISINNRTNQYFLVEPEGKNYKLAFTHIKQPSDLRLCGQDLVVVSGSIGECGDEFILLVRAVRRDDVVSDPRPSREGKD